MHFLWKPACERRRVPPLPRIYGRLGRSHVSRGASRPAEPAAHIIIRKEEGESCLITPPLPRRRPVKLLRTRRWPWRRDRRRHCCCCKLPQIRAKQDRRRHSARRARPDVNAWNQRGGNGASAICRIFRSAAAKQRKAKDRGVLFWWVATSRPISTRLQETNRVVIVVRMSNKTVVAKRGQKSAAHT